ncbi:DNA translocase FtsK [Rhizobium sp. EC-SD404]|uniref:DNA translocase FtsK n=1 Tax=Rhizobium sp. EC-SD404 TaxID=2038389 RepID=UPI001259BBA7|nr:DNA translocase FtsK [Rhizobium sp. EC-SD404]VVT00045.1 DNA translocase FtsK [Rhizobium sp. EC-SD404]
MRRAIEVENGSFGGRGREKPGYSQLAARQNQRSIFRIPPLLKTPLRITGALTIVALLAFAVGALATWNVNDPSFSYAHGGRPTNALGFAGAAFADLGMQFFGLGAVFAMIAPVFWAIFLFRGVPLVPIFRRMIAWIFGAALFSAVLACITPPAHWPLPTGIGGVFGDMVLRVPASLIGGFPSGIYSVLVGLVLIGPAVWLSMYAAVLVDRRDVFEADDQEDFVEADEEDEDDFEPESGRLLALGAMAHWWYSMRATARRISGGRIGKDRGRDEFEEPYDFNDDTFVTLDGRREPEMTARVATVSARRAEPSIEFDDAIDDEDALDFAPGVRRAPARPVEPAFDDPMLGNERDDLDDDVDLDDGMIEPDWAPAAAPQRQPARPVAEAPVARAAVPVQKVRKPVKIDREALANSGDDGFDLPSLELLNEAQNLGRDASLSDEILEQNARMLEGVLEDFGVKGEIIQVKPGPVVTLYELEPAPGIKSSRVIGLADDIARSMSAIAARVAVVPGRNAIGIELPNARRETVYLREIIASRDFEQSKAKLALALGKSINGDAVVVDIAKMPHVLVAGTTGSGKSVAINTMILSIVYRMSPEKCRLIMIDPKMLELSVYDGIPHLLTPVVTDPKKAVVALKWTVREMEERYKKMSKIGVRNIDGFNQRVEQALKKGDIISRTVQTGFDRETGEAVYETEEFAMEAMPYIVVIIDEMADLMMVAGKEIEGAVQRLAQMARAAGIHVIMATQRPSVDVITGTIKANFPTRISFQVTSKIDSRTILGEQGAEQLLGMGDMLYMAGGGRIQRVHGPFVSDEEVEDVVAHLKAQGVPEYLDAITEDDEDGEGGPGGGGPAGTSNLEGSDDPYDQAVAVVLRDGKVSTSYIQRRLGIGYNRAASLIERMEKEGVIGPANHAGKREILVPTEDDISGR